jgi:hypothetical protein
MFRTRLDLGEPIAGRGIEIAEAWREGRAVELWSRDRMVKTWQ